MYFLTKKLNIDLLREIYHFNNYSDLDLEYFKFLHNDKMENVLRDLEIGGDLYRYEEHGCYGIDFMEYLFDFTPIKTKYKHRCVFARFESIDDLYNHSEKIKDRFI